MLIIKKVIFFSLLFYHGIGLSQEISGVILDGKTNIPLEGASVYFDNTTFGTNTNADGEFILEFHKNIKTPLVISYLGYKTKILNKFSTVEKSKIFIFESVNTLNEVVLTSENNWSRELKLSEFRKHYLGESKNSNSCEILNEEEIVLNYNKKDKLLTAKAKAPILIRNSNLQYLISSELQHFEVSYSFVSRNKKRLHVNYVFYSGSKFFKSLQVSPSTDLLNYRNEAYFGSTLHFMRALADNKLKKEKYRFFLEDQPINDNVYIKVSPVEGNNSVQVRLEQKLNISYDHRKQSSIECKEKEFYIDSFGNYYPPGRVKLGGDLGNQRIGDALPLDYVVQPAKAIK